MLYQSPGLRSGRDIIKPFRSSGERVAKSGIRLGVGARPEIETPSHKNRLSAEHFPVLWHVGSEARLSRKVGSLLTISLLCDLGPFLKSGALMSSYMKWGQSPSFRATMRNKESVLFCPFHILKPSNFPVGHTPSSPYFTDEEMEAPRG